MKNLILLITVLLSFSVANGQVTFSSGISKRVETKWNRHEFSKFFTSGHTNNLWNDYFVAGIDYKENSLLLSADFTYFTNDLSIETHQADYLRGSHGAMLHEDYINTSAHINYSYSGLKLGLNKIFFKDGIYNLILGATLHLEFLSLENEYKHIYEHYSVYHSYGFDYENQQKLHTTTTVRDPISYKPFDALTMRNMFVTTGVSIKNRFNLKSLFIELDFTLGNSYANRTHLNNVNPPEYGEKDPNNGVRRFTEIGIKIGYKLPFKGSLQLTEVD